MPANNTHWLVHYWQGLYGGLAHLYTPERTEIGYPHIPYAIDPATYALATKGLMHRWAADRYRKCLERCTTLSRPPLWILAPDVPFNWTATLELWDRWEPELRGYGWPLAIAVQNGATPKEVRGLNADVVFVGGDDEWKWGTVEEWCRETPRVHLARCNSPEALYYLHGLGVESCDGTGWFLGDADQLVGLEAFLRWQADPNRHVTPVAMLSRKGRTRGPKQEAFW